MSDLTSRRAWGPSTRTAIVLSRDDVRRLTGGDGFSDAQSRGSEPQTRRLRIGLLVTSNRFRPPAMLAKIAATVDVVSGGRLNFGIGAGSRPSAPIARREYEAHGLPFNDAAHAVGALAEALAVITRLWSQAEPFDFDGDYVHLRGAFGNPKPVQQPHPPIVIGGAATSTLRVVARYRREELPRRRHGRRRLPKRHPGPPVHRDRS